MNQLEGVECNPSEGAMYVFCKISLPINFIEKAKSLQKQPDTLYCLQLLEDTGVCVVPGNGFGQAPNTFHFRATFLPPEEEFDEFIQKINVFHTRLMQDYQ